MIGARIFEDLQTKIDEDVKVQEQLRDILQDLDKQCMIWRVCRLAARLTGRSTSNTVDTGSRTLYTANAAQVAPELLTRRL